MALSSLVYLLITLAVVIGVVFVILWATRQLLSVAKWPAEINTVIYVIVVLLCLAGALAQFGFIGSGPFIRLR